MAQTFPLIFFLIVLAVGILLYLATRGGNGTEPVQAVPAHKTIVHCKSVPLMNRSETRVFRHIHRYLQARSLPLFVSPQVSYGGFLQTQDRSQWRKVNFKRADLVIWDYDGNVKAVLEYDGEGHRGNTVQQGLRADAADAVKDTACTSAGIPVVRILPGYNSANLDQALDSIFNTGKTA